MSKERLEEIERQLNRAEIKRENLDIEDFQNILEQQLINGNLKWLVKYAREQAERVEELEEHIDYLYDNNVHLKGDYKLQKQNERYREAIKKGIKATRYTNPGIAYILAEVLEGEE